MQERSITLCAKCVHVGGCGESKPLPASTTCQKYGTDVLKSYTTDHDFTIKQFYVFPFEVDLLNSLAFSIAATPGRRSLVSNRRGGRVGRQGKGMA